MANNTQRTTSIQRRLNTRLRTNPAYVELAQAIDTVTRKTVTGPRDELATIRDTRNYHRGDWTTLDDGRRAIINHIAFNEEGSVTAFAQIPSTGETFEIILPNDNLKDRSVLINSARYHGFNYYSDTLSNEDYARIVDYIEDFWPESGTDSYYRFIGFIKNMRLEADYLWTTDEVDETGDDTYPWLEPNNGQLRPVHAGGHDYPTSHVQLRYDALETPDPDGEDIFRLFYLLAPIHLVLERIVAELLAAGGSLKTVAVPFFGIDIGAALDLNVNETYETGRIVVGQPALSVEPGAVLDLLESPVPGSTWPVARFRARADIRTVAVVRVAPTVSLELSARLDLTKDAADGWARARYRANIDKTIRDYLRLSPMMITMQSASLVFKGERRLTDSR